MARNFGIVPAIIGENVVLSDPIAHITLLEWPTCLFVVHCDLPARSVSAIPILALETEDAELSVLIAW